LNFSAAAAWDEVLDIDHDKPEKGCQVIAADIAGEPVFPKSPVKLAREIPVEHASSSSSSSGVTSAIWRFLVKRTFFNPAE
jgi:hypothetical protein